MHLFTTTSLYSYRTKHPSASLSPLSTPGSYALCLSWACHLRIGSLMDRLATCLSTGIRMALRLTTCLPCWWALGSTSGWIHSARPSTRESDSRLICVSCSSSSRDRLLRFLIIFVCLIRGGCLRLSKLAFRGLGSGWANGDVAQTAKSAAVTTRIWNKRGCQL